MDDLLEAIMCNIFLLSLTEHFLIGQRTIIIGQPVAEIKSSPTKKAITWNNAPINVNPLGGGGGECGHGVGIWQILKFFDQIP